MPPAEGWGLRNLGLSAGVFLAQELDDLVDLSEGEGLLIRVLALEGLAGADYFVVLGVGGELRHDELL